MFETVISPVLWEILGILGSAILGILGIILIAAAKTWLNKLGISLSETSYNDIISIITNIIKALYQKYTKTIKDNSKDGKLTDQQAKLIREKAISLIKATLSLDQVKILLNKYNMDDIDKVLEIILESVLLDVKNDLKDDLVIKTTDLTEDVTNSDSTTNNKSCVKILSNEEVESLNACSADCSVCPLRDNCIYNRCKA